VEKGRKLWEANDEVDLVALGTSAANDREVERIDMHCWERTEVRRSRFEDKALARNGMLMTMMLLALLRGLLG
jgi:hypothetical protein